MTEQDLSFNRVPKIFIVEYRYLHITCMEALRNRLESQLSTLINNTSIEYTVESIKKTNINTPIDNPDSYNIRISNKITPIKPSEKDEELFKIFEDIESHLTDNLRLNGMGQVLNYDIQFQLPTDTTLVQYSESECSAVLCVKVHDPYTPIPHPLFQQIIYPKLRSKYTDPSAKITSLSIQFPSQEYTISGVQVEIDTDNYQQYSQQANTPAHGAMFPQEVAIKFDYPNDSSTLFNTLNARLSKQTQQIEYPYPFRIDPQYVSTHADGDSEISYYIYIPITGNTIGKADSSNN